jgi:hypothetical protein
MKRSHSWSFVVMRGQNRASTPAQPESRAPCPACRAGNFPQNLIKNHHRGFQPPPARRISAVLDSAARIPRLAHPKLRTAPRENPAPRDPVGAMVGDLEPFKNISRTVPTERIAPAPVTRTLAYRLTIQYDLEGICGTGLRSEHSANI